MSAGEKTKKEWTAKRTSPVCIQVLCNGFRMGSILLKDDCGGQGWIFLPNFQAKPSRKRWGDPLSAIKDRLPPEAFSAVAGLIENPA